ncbi:hypothetical protein VM1G_03522 [Cytospora mali]|uniref:Heterokaryon incompatibility domain-containing protein n=1 Tax=Cytospora mali TaxID=578113 RepID=A0A194VTJ1_CYTMA|nr:hypothetical protein VM1G_03522 [Valsa mali]
MQLLGSDLNLLPRNIGCLEAVDRPQQASSIAHRQARPSSHKDAMAADVEKLWPRRLLDIPTMTSIERQDGNKYGGEREPRYSVLSYTWGRFQAFEDDAPRLPVSSVSWKIPAVDETWFTAASFSRVLERIGETSRFVWLDIACIDQEDHAVKLDEVGRQAGIFANAYRVETPAEFYGTRAETHELPDLAARLGDAVKIVLSDWWFSSLWTLQEGSLRRDAEILSRDAERIRDIRVEDAIPEYIIVATIATAIWDVFLYVGESGEQDPVSWSVFHGPSMRDMGDQIARQIREAGGLTGFGMSTNPNIQFAAARFRKTTNELDRIYGIMATYNIRVGSDASRKYTLEELAYEFATTLNGKSPLLGQLFIHLDEPRPGTTWQITQRSRVPRVLSSWTNDLSSSDDCHITGRVDGRAMITGQVTPLKGLVSLWRAFENVKESYLWAGFRVIMDDYICQPYTEIPSYNDRKEVVANRQQAREIAQSVLQVFDSTKLAVLTLGRAKGGGEMEFYGLILQLDKDDHKQCRRLGLCSWHYKRTMRTALDPSLWPVSENYYGVIG